MDELKKRLKKFWNWLWKSDSFWSYLVLILLIFIFIKLIFFPILGLIFNTSLPLAIVESNSMNHQIVRDDANRLNLCGNFYSNKEKISFDKYWDICGQWYEENADISKEQFKEFKFNNGFKKGDLMIISNWGETDVGDILIFQTNRRYPLIHRVISLNPISTKGDHNEIQLNEEKIIQENQIIGKAIFRIPYVGWPKVALCEIADIPIICA